MRFPLLDQLALPCRLERVAEGRGSARLAFMLGAVRLQRPPFRE